MEMYQDSGIRQGTGLAIRDIDDLGRVGKMLAQSNYFSDASDIAKASVKVMAGMEGMKLSLFVNGLDGGEKYIF